MTSRFRRVRGGVEIHLEATEYAVLDRVPSLVGSIGAGREDPAAARLDPAVHPDDDRASAEFARLAGADVTRGRAHDAEVFESTLRRAATDRLISAEEAEVWVRVLGTARVALVARSGMDFDDASFAAADRSQPDLLLVDYLGMLQEELVFVLLAELPAGPGT